MSIFHEISVRLNTFCDYNSFRSNLPGEAITDQYILLFVIQIWA